MQFVSQSFSISNGLSKISRCLFKLYSVRSSCKAFAIGVCVFFPFFPGQSLESRALYLGLYSGLREAGNLALLVVFCYVRSRLGALE